MSNAILPCEKQEKTIDSMFPGETGFTVPWAVMVDLDRLMWIRGDYPIDENKGGTAQMKVHRNREGFEIEVPLNERYELVRLGSSEHIDYALQPVTKISWLAMRQQWEQGGDA